MLTVQHLYLAPWVAFTLAIQAFMLPFIPILCCVVPLLVTTAQCGKTDRIHATDFLHDVYHVHQSQLA